MELSSLIDIKKRPSNSTKSSSQNKSPKKNIAKQGPIANKGPTRSSSAKKISLSPKMKRRSKKRPAVAKDIFQIEKTIQRKSNEEAAEKVAAEKVAAEKVAAAKAVKEAKAVSQVAQDNSRPKIPHEKSRRTSHKKRSIRKRSRSKRNVRKGRQIKVKSSTVSEKDIESIQKHINKIRNQSSQDIKEDLRKKGIRVSGKSDRLLKDIYFYSKVCNLNIVHEK